MRIFFLIFLKCLNAAAVKHSLQYFYTASVGVSIFPEFMTVGLVDGQPFSYYDSVIRREIPKQDWMAMTADPEYWEEQTQVSISAEQAYKSNIQIAKQRFNQTGDVHVFQMMGGCQWDDETDEVKGYRQYGYDGEDFISLDLKSKSWTAAKQQAVMTKNKLDSNKGLTATFENYHLQICPNWLQKYLNSGRSFLMRTVLPSVSLLQKTSSSPVSCHATGFYPNRAEMFWRKGGEEIHEGVEKGEILPNNDGTFQMSVELKPAEDASKYECVFQLVGEKDVNIKLEKTRIRTNEINSIMMIIGVVVSLVVLVVVAVVGFIIYKKKNNKCPPSPVENTEVQQKMLPKA